MIEAFLENHIATVGALLFILAYSQGIIEVFKTKTADRRMLPFWASINAAVFMLFVNSVYLFVKYGTYGYLIMESFNFGLAFVMLVMTIRYREKEAK